MRRAHVDDDSRGIPKVLPLHHLRARRAIPIAHGFRKRRRADVGRCGSVGSRCMGDQKSAKPLMRAEFATTVAAPVEGLSPDGLGPHRQVTAWALHAINLAGALGFESSRRWPPRSNATMRPPAHSRTTAEPGRATLHARADAAGRAGSRSGFRGRTRVSPKNPDPV